MSIKMKRVEQQFDGDGGRMKARGESKGKEAGEEKND